MSADRLSADGFSAEHGRDGDTVTISCDGELDISTAPLVEQLIESALAEPSGIRLVQLDWMGLTFMDSTGIRLLFRIVKRCRASGMDLVWRLSEPAQRAVDAVGIHDALLRQAGDDPGGR